MFPVRGEEYSYTTSICGEILSSRKCEITVIQWTYKGRIQDKVILSGKIKKLEHTMYLLKHH